MSERPAGVQQLHDAIEAEAGPDLDVELSGLEWWHGLAALIGYAAAWAVVDTSAEAALVVVAFLGWGVAVSGVQRQRIGSLSVGLWFEAAARLAAEDAAEDAFERRDLVRRRELARVDRWAAQPLATYRLLRRWAGRSERKEGAA